MAKTEQTVDLVGPGTALLDDSACFQGALAMCGAFRSTSISILLVLALSGCPELCFGQVTMPNGAGSEEEPTAKEKTESATDVGPVTVTANRARKAAFKVARSVEIISEKSIARKAPKGIPDMLDETPGVHVQKTNAGAGAPIIRGLVGPENLILVDGVRFNNSTFRTGPNQYLAMIDPWAVGRLEVLRGPGSVMYGSDAMGGVINAISRSPRDLKGRLFGGSARLMFASGYPGGGGTGQADFHKGSFKAYGGGTYLKYGEVRAGGGEKQPISDFSRSSARLRTAYTLSAKWSLSQAAFFTSVRNAGRAEKLYKGDYRFYDNDDMLAYVRAIRKGTGLAQRVELNVSYHWTNDVVRRFGCDTGDILNTAAACLDRDLSVLQRKRHFADSVHTPGYFATWEARFWNNRGRTLLGSEGYFDFITSSAREAKKDEQWQWKNKGRGNFSNDSRYASLGIFLLGDLDLLRASSHRVNLSGGVRGSYFSAAAPDVPALGDVDYSHSGVVGTAGLKYLFDKSVNVYADFSQGFRAPNLQETTVLGDTGDFFEIPNDALSPQRSNTLEVGTKLRTRYVRLAAAGFASWLDDIIAREPVPLGQLSALGLSEDDVGDTTVVRRVNADRGFYKGVEGSLLLGPFSGVTAWANGAWVQGDITRQDGSEEPARRGPPILGAGGIRWEKSKYRLYAEFYVRWALAQDRLSPEDAQDIRICGDPDNPGSLLADCPGTPGWYTLNLRAGYAPKKWLHFDLNLENLTDAHYRLHGSGIDSPGFNLLLSVAVKQ